MLAARPSKPVDVVISDPKVTSDQILKVKFGNPAPVNQGSPILSYELQMDDGKSGEFSSI